MFDGDLTKRPVGLLQGLPLLTGQIRVRRDRLQHRRPGLVLLRGGGRSESADNCNESANDFKTCSDGSRRPRSICDRYGLEMPAIAANCRIGNAVNSRCRRMISPNDNDSGHGVFTAPP